MTTDERDFERAQLVQLEHLARLAGNHPIMGPQIAFRKQDIEKALSLDSSAPVQSPTFRIFFSGPPVNGSQGIDAKFAAEGIRLAQEMVSSQYALTKFGDLGERGPRRNEPEASLFLTALPRGSFGLELKKPRLDDWVAAQQLQTVIDEITQAVGASGESDEAFDKSLETLPWRVIDRLKDFITLIRDYGAAVRISTPNRQVALDKEHVISAAQRLEALQTETDEVPLNGVFGGGGLNTLWFEYTIAGGVQIRGKIAESVPNQTILDWIRNLTGQATLGQFRRERMVTRSGRERIHYELLDLQPIRHSTAQ